MSVNQTVINDVEPRTQSTATGGQVTFNTNWTADAAADVLVYSRVADAIADDQTQLVSSEDYTVEFVGTYQTVRITFSEGRTAGDIVTISRATPSDRENLYTNTNFTPSMLNQDFGILTLVDQENQMYDQDLCPHYNISATYTNTSDIEIDTVLPILDANEFWVKNPGNTAITKATLDSGNLPAAGPFITYTADSALVGAFDMGLLAAGIVAQTVSSSVATPYILPIPLDVDKGGTGLAALTPYAVLIGGATSTADVAQVTALGSSGQVLTSNGAGAAPTFQAITGGYVATQYFYVSGTYTPTAGATRAIVEVVGGGGGSGGTAATGGATFAVSAGGAGGGYGRKYLSSLSSQTVTVGAGGLAGAAGNNTGGTGGTTSFGALVSATGGGGGGGSPASGGGFAITPGFGGTGVGGDLNLIGSDGGTGQGFPALQVSVANFGGGSFFAGSRYSSPAPATPIAGYPYGGGASGLYVGTSHAAVAGAAGGVGVCIVTEFN